jgi:hypothetical protein
MPGCKSGCHSFSLASGFLKNYSRVVRFDQNILRKGITKMQLTEQVRALPRKGKGDNLTMVAITKDARNLLRCTAAQYDTSMASLAGLAIEKLISELRSQSATEKAA